MDSGHGTQRAVSRPFVGREREMNELGRALDEAAAGRGGLVLLLGEPGIGKTRTTEEIAARAEERGAEVLIGRCYEDEGAPALWPWTQILRAYARVRGDAELGVALGAEAAEVVQVVPELRTRVPGDARPPSPDSQAARFRLFDGIGTFLGRAARVRPIVLVLDDLHGADQPSLLLLRFLARGLQEVPLLIVGTFRDVALTSGNPLAETLGELLREPVTTHLSLRGFDAVEVARLVEATTGVLPPPALVARIHERTEGNPFFVGEIVRWLADTGELERPGRGIEIAIPAGVRAAVGRRLGQLSDGCSDVLRLASGFGREFRADALARASGLGGDRLADLLAEALAVRVVGTLPERPDRYRFAHALTRDTLYEEIPAPRRAELHRRLALALEAVTATEAEPPLAELAHHLGQGGPAEGERAIGYARRAGDRAMAVFAYEEAARLYEVALRADEGSGPVNEERRCDLLLALGNALDSSGERVPAKEYLQRALELARRLTLPEHFARAALALGGPRLGMLEVGRYDVVQADILHEALGQVGPADSMLRVRLLSRLSAELYFSKTWERGDALSQEAVDVARRLGDPGTLAVALEARHVATFGPNVHERLAMATEMVQLTESGDDREITFAARAFRIADLFELGDTDRMDAELDVFTRLAMKNRLAYWTYIAATLRSLRAVVDGRFTEAERLAIESLTLGQQIHVRNATQMFGLQMTVLSVLQGKAPELKGLLQGNEELRGDIPLAGSLVAWLYAQLGDREKAASELERVAAGDFANIRRDGFWLAAVTLAAETCSFLRDARRAEILYGVLSPYAELSTLPPLWGVVARYLGLLATTLGRWDEAGRHFEAACAMNARRGWRPWLAYTQYDYAAMLLERAAADDHAKAQSLLSAAFETSEALGMAALADKSRALREVASSKLGALAGRLSTQHEPPAPPPVHGGTPEEATFRRQGEYWTIAFEGASIQLRHTRGLGYLGRLLLRPGREFHAGDLARDDTSETRPAHIEGLPSRREVGGTGDVVDAKSRAQYRERLAELREELSEAEGLNDLGRAARARDEVDALTSELVAAARGSRAASHAERARIAVTKGVKAALGRITASHPSLGRHLSATVRCGYFCVYQPDPRRPIRWAG